MKRMPVRELRRLTPRPERKLAVLTCMDTRLSILTLGLKAADAHIIRNAGGIVTDDSLRSLLISHYLLGTEEFMIINHTDCGLMHASEQDLRTRIQNQTGTAAIAPAFFYAFQNIEENVAPTEKIAHPSVDPGESGGARVCVRRNERVASRSTVNLRKFPATAAA